MAPRLTSRQLSQPLSVDSGINIQQFLLLLYLILLPNCLIGQLIIEGIHPFNKHHSGQIAVVLTGGSIQIPAGYASFQIVDTNGDTITDVTGPKYFLPYNSALTFMLQLKDGVAVLPDTFCGSLNLKNPEMEIDFCRSNQRLQRPPGKLDCEKYLFVDLIHSGEYWNDEVSILLSYKDDLTRGIVSGYTSFQLFSNNGDTITSRTGPDYFLPVISSDTIAYNLKLVDETFSEQIRKDSGCFILRMENPSCETRLCQFPTATIEVQRNKIHIYPNPFNNEIWINNVTVDALEVISINGDIIYSQKGNVSNLDLSFLGTGVYFLNLIQNQWITTHKIIKM